jgi:ribosomal protein L11 methylase PrmA
MSADPASFRDPSGRVYDVDGRILRAVAPSAREGFEAAWNNPALKRLVAEGYVVDAVAVGDAPPDAPADATIVEHARLPFVSYPYEWSFSLMKRAALHHLDLQISLLQGGLALSDATAYNVQFVGVRPIFIDALSFRPYADGEYWTGHRQFCEQFLNPLLLRALLGAPHNDWFRGSLEGVPTPTLARLIPPTKRFSINVLAHVLAPAGAQARGAREMAKSAVSRPLPKSSYLGILRQLRDWIAKLRPLGADNTVWRDYADNNSYASDEARAKERVIAEFAQKLAPKQLWDLGCNTGHYSEVALLNGARAVIGFDADFGALEAAFARADEKRLNFLPLYQDAANPTPSQGWAGVERKSLADRSASAEATIALAFVHHLAIGRNIPLDRFVDWLVGLAPTGVVEFTPKTDPMVERLLEFRKDIFPDYAVENFAALIEKRARLVSSETVTAAGRRLFVFDRR